MIDGREIIKILWGALLRGLDVFPVHMYAWARDALTTSYIGFEFLCCDVCEL